MIPLLKDRNMGILKRLLVLGVPLLAVPGMSVSAAAQPAGKVYRIGTLATSPIHPAFAEGLHELGYDEGINLVFVHRRAKRIAEYPKLAGELVALDVDLILTVGVSPTRAAKQATRTIPVVMGNSSADPVSQGLIDSLARPGENVTGVFDLTPNLAGKRLELLREIFPRLTRVVHLSPGTTPVGPAHFKAMSKTADSLGVQVRPMTVKSPDELEGVFRTAAAEKAEALVLLGVSFFIPLRSRIVSLAAKYRLPVMYTNQGWVPQGGLVAYASDSGARYRRAAWYVDRIFKGARPADLPAEQPKKFLLEVNLRTANALGVKIPRSILLRADRVIE